MLTRRLQALVEAGLLEKRRYSARPPRYEYVLTERGRDFRPVLLALLAYGNRHFAPEGASVMVVDAITGEPAEPDAGRQAQRAPARRPRFRPRRRSRGERGDEGAARGARRAPGSDRR